VSKLKIGLSSLNFPVTMARYMWGALDERDDVETYMIAPHYGDFIPWTPVGGGNGIHLPAKYVKEPWAALPASWYSSIPYPMAKPHMPEPDIKFDVFIMIDAGFRFSTRPNADVVAHILTDPHAIAPRDYSVGSRVSDHVFSMQTPYMKPGEHYLPYAYSPKWHYPEDAEKEYDACLIGLLYDHRQLLMSQLRAKGLEVYYNIGEVYDEYRQRYAKSRLALNWSSKLDLPTRVFEAFAMNIPLVTNRVPDISNFFVEDEHYLGFDTIGEGVEKALWAINNEDAALEMAHAAYRKVTSSGHSWKDRMQFVLETIKVI